MIIEANFGENPLKVYQKQIKLLSFLSLLPPGISFLSTSSLWHAMRGEKIVVKQKVLANNKNWIMQRKSLVWLALVWEYVTEKLPKNSYFILFFVSSRYDSIVWIPTPFIKGGWGFQKWLSWGDGKFLLEMGGSQEWGGLML